MTIEAKSVGPIPGLTGAILAGGQARRMGRINKALLEVGGVPIFDRILAVLASCCERVVVIANQPEPYVARGLAVFPDALPGCGSLGGLYTALETAPTEHVFVCACDMPFVSAPLLRYLARRVEDFDAVVPRDQYGLQPMHAIYSRAPRTRLRERLEKGLLKVEHYLDDIRTHVLAPEEVAAVEPQGLTFLNVNTPDDFAKADASCRDGHAMERIRCASR